MMRMPFGTGTGGSDAIRHRIVLDPGQVDEAIAYMRSPGTIDLTGLRFHTATAENMPQDRRAKLVDAVVDIAVFPLPSKTCAEKDCDLSNAGVGKPSMYNGLRFTSLCHRGRLQIDDALFRGHHFSVGVPKDGDMDSRIDAVAAAKFDVTTTDADYEVVLANCNGRGRQVQISGDVVFDLATYEPAGGSAMGEEYAVQLSYLLVFLAVFCCLCCAFVRCRCLLREVAMAAVTDEDGTEYEYESVEAENVSIV